MSISVQIQKKLATGFSLDLAFETTGESCLGILGASGSGKSMTLKCIAGIEKPDSGQIQIDKKDVYNSEKKINLKPQKRHVGYLFQQYALFPTMTVYKNIIAALPSNNKTKREEANYLISKFNLTGLEKHLPYQLSGGEQQRTAIARMLINKPQAILLDEPFSALDANLREQMQLEFAALLNTNNKEQCNNAILVTHSRDEVFKLCPQLIIMDKGKIIASGKTASVFNNPVSLKAAELTGCKNITKAKKTGAKEISALDWGTTLHTASEVPENITHAGIRAHHIRAVQSAENTCNEITIEVKKLLSDPFETTILFTNAAANNIESQKEIWWQYPQASSEAPAKKVFFPPESLLLLVDNG